MGGDGEGVMDGRIGFDEIAPRSVVQPPTKRAATSARTRGLLMQAVPGQRCVTDHFSDVTLRAQGSRETWECRFVTNSRSTGLHHVRRPAYEPWAMSLVSTTGSPT
jgi:hypothetical protein